jgi:hypothetical protein
VLVHGIPHRLGFTLCLPCLIYYISLLFFFFFLPSLHHIISSHHEKYCELLRLSCQSTITRTYRTPQHTRSPLSTKTAAKPALRSTVSVRDRNEACRPRIRSPCFCFAPHSDGGDMSPIPRRRYWPWNSQCGMHWLD